MLVAEQKMGCNLSSSWT